MTCNPILTTVNVVKIDWCRWCSCIKGVCALSYGLQSWHIKVKLFQIGLLRADQTFPKISTLSGTGKAVGRWIRLRSLPALETHPTIPAPHSMLPNLLISPIFCPQSTPCEFTSTVRSWKAAFLWPTATLSSSSPLAHVSTLYFGNWKGHCATRRQVLKVQWPVGVGTNVTLNPQPWSSLVSRKSRTAVEITTSRVTTEENI